MKLIAQGAEAKLYEDNGNIVKDRFQKKYRHPELDIKLRKSRTKREAKILEKLAAINFSSPKLIKNNEKDMLIIQRIEGMLVKDMINSDNYIKLMGEIGEKIAILHNNTIIHGDLTTSNIIYQNTAYFIDFGLSFFSHKIEDKAVDLYLLKQSLESKHYQIFENAFKEVLKSYEKKAIEGNLVIKRLEVVEKRGRYKHKGKMGGKDGKQA